MAHYVGLKDLIERWVYTRQGVHKLLRRADFPKPDFTVNAGKTPVWFLPDIKLFEKHHPELTSREAKLRKVAGYAAANFKKKARNA